MNTKRNVGVCLILCLPVFVVGTYIYSSFLPREYFSHAIIEEPEHPTGVFSENHKDEYTEPGFTLMQFQILQSKEIVYPVIDELNLIYKWTTDGQKLPKDQVYFRILKKMVLKNEVIKSKGLIDIGVWSHDPQEATNIANAIALHYQKKCIEDKNEMISQYIAVFKQEIEGQRIKVERAEEKLAKIRKRDHVVDAGASVSNQVGVDQYSGGEEPSADYLKAKNYWLEQKKILEAAETGDSLKSRMETINFYHPAKLWEKAEPSIVPARPNVPLIMLIGSGIGFLLAIIGGVLVLLGLRAQKA